MRGRITKENNGRVNLIAENWTDDKKDQKNNWGGGGNWNKKCMRMNRNDIEIKGEKKNKTKELLNKNTEKKITWRPDTAQSSYPYFLPVSLKDEQ